MTSVKSNDGHAQSAAVFAYSFTKRLHSALSIGIRYCQSVPASLRQGIFLHRKMLRMNAAVAVVRWLDVSKIKYMWVCIGRRRFQGHNIIY